VCAIPTAACTNHSVQGSFQSYCQPFTRLVVIGDTVRYTQWGPNKLVICKSKHTLRTTTSILHCSIVYCSNGGIVRSARQFCMQRDVPSRGPTTPPQQLPTHHRAQGSPGAIGAIRFCWVGWAPWACTSASRCLDASCSRPVVHTQQR